jgi:1,4-alpha-glucan branching enzyme
MKQSQRKPAADRPTDSAHTQIVRLNYANPDARLVCVAGSFNDWHPSVSEMIELGHGRWAKDLTLAPGKYEYRFVVDGEWLPDPECSEMVPNPFSGYDSVLTVPSPAQP